MANTKPAFKKIKVTPDVEKQIMENLLVGIPAVESAKDGYRALNKTTNALGKYQFVPSYWWDDIQKFGEENGFEAESYEDFLGSPTFQDLFFRDYVKNVIIPDSVKIYNKGENPGNLSLEDIAVLNHFQGQSTTNKIVTTGKGLDKTDTNISTNTYLDKYRGAVESSGKKPVAVKPELTVEEKSDLKDKYLKREKAIDKADISQGEKEKMRGDLWRDIAINGHEEIYDSAIDEQNKKLQSDYEQQRESYAKEQAKIAKKNAQKTSRDTTGRIAKQDARRDPLMRSPDLEKDLAAWNKSQPEAPKPVTAPVFKKKPDWTGIKSQAEKQQEAERQKQQTEKPQASEEEAAIATTEKETPSYSDDLGIVDQLSRQAKNSVDAIKGSQQYSYNPKNTKGQLPIDSLVGGAIGLMGSQQAKNVEVPERDEEYSEALMHFASDLAKKSNEGLPPHVEAAMKSKLDESYQAGIQQIKNASGGNRALILGNQGQLESARSKGLVNIGLADYEAKERAFQAYGEALRHQNDFETRKNIANHSIAYREALRKRDVASATSASGFKMLMDDIAHQKANGPGSVNDMARSYFEQKIFGFDSKAKPGAPNSKEAWEAQEAKKLEEAGILDAWSESASRLSPEKKGLLSDFRENNSNFTDLIAFTDYLSDNDVDPGNYDSSRIDQASKNKDFGLVFGMEQPKQNTELPTRTLGPQEELTSPAGILAKVPGENQGTPVNDQPQQGPLQEDQIPLPGIVPGFAYQDQNSKAVSDLRNSIENNGLLQL